ncbi:MAG: PIN domain nuclease [Opitutus sp.]|nr:PIN domain nuclease [Opitutus sp.]
MTAESVYIDSSALRHLYVHGSRSAAMSAWRFRCPGSLPLTRFGRAEICNAILGAAFRGDLTGAVAQLSLAGFENDINSGDIRLVDLPWRRALDRTAELSRAHTITLGTRTLDVLHVASALELGARTLVTYDTRQAALAKAVGLKTLAP